MRNYFDMGSIFVVIITLILFIVALFTKGFTHDLLLESGVFLVSVNFIIMAYHNSLSVKSIENRLQEIKVLLGQK